MNEEARPFEEYKEMIKDMRKEEMIKGLYDLSKNIIEKGKEIERLNNIIKRFEEDLREIYLTFGEFSEEYTENCIKKLKEGGDSENL